MASPWKPEQYERFRDERSQPFFDLLKLVHPVPDGRVVDLGCGTGELTRELHLATQAAETLGIDSSETMLAKSVGFAGSGLRFEQGSISDFVATPPFDVVFSNAALQWIDGHEVLFPQVCAMAAAGGQLALQMPANNDHPSHQIAFAVAQEEPFRTVLKGYQRVWPVQPPEWYADRLDRLGFTEQAVRLQVYGHHLESREGVIEWVKGTLLTDYERRMPAETYRQFLERYKQRLFEHLEDRRPFFYPFKRILIWGRKG